MTTEPTHEEYFEFALSLAKKAGDKIRVAFYAPKEVTFKDTIDLVTKTDKEVEEMLVSDIKNRFPGHLFVAEETVSDGNATEVLTDAPTWLIDPIDGTTNFVHKFPFCAVSIGLAIKQQVVVGIVYNPVLEDLFTAVRGQGAKRNGKPINVSQTDNLKHCLIATGFPYDRSQSQRITNQLKVVLENVRDIRRAGSAALDMCFVASGVLEAYYEEGIHAWDIAAGGLILEEAGGVVGSLDGEAFNLCRRQVLATNKAIHSQFKSLLFSYNNK